MALQEFDLIFSQGVDGYSGVFDTMLFQNTANTSYGSDTSVSVDASPNSQVLLRFDDIFSSDRIPLGATILSANLILNTVNGGNGGTLHRMLTSWSEASTWNSLVSGVSLNGVEAVAAADVSTGTQAIGTSTIDVTSSVQAWADGAANYGWVISSLGSNGWDFSTSESSISPQLVVRYQVGAPPPPAVNTPPVANPDAATVQQNSTTFINVLANDADADGNDLSVTSVGSPSHGTAQLGSNNQITYTPTPQFVGTDTFTYAISDGNGGTASSTVNVTVQQAPPLEFTGATSYVAIESTGGATNNLEHTNSSKSFYNDGTWWAVLPENISGTGSSWGVYEFSENLPGAGDLGGWSRASGALMSGSFRADIAWDDAHDTLYVLQYGLSQSSTYLLQLLYDEIDRSWETIATVNITQDLNNAIFGSNGHLALGIDHSGNPLVAAIASGAQTKGLHLAYSTTADLANWTYTTLDPNTTNSGGSNGDSRADFVLFGENGAEKVGIIYSQDGSSSNAWRFMWADSQQNALNYQYDWTSETITTNVTIDNHISAASVGGTIYAAIKDAYDSIWLLKGAPGAWEQPILVVSGASHAPSRPILTIDETNEKLYIAYQGAMAPYNDVYMKVADLNNPIYTPSSLGTKIIDGTSSSDRFFDPQGPVHNVGAESEDYFLLFAKDSSDSSVWYNGISLSDWDIIT